MKQVIKKLNVYRFNELSKKAQENALSHIDLVWDDWYDCLLEDWQEKFSEYGIEDAKFTFDLYGGWVRLSQAKFDLEKMINAFLPEYTVKHNLKKWFLEVSSIDLYGRDEVIIETNIYSGNYPHIDAYIDSVAADINKILDGGLQNLLNKVLKDLRKEYDYLESDEAKIEYINDNDKWFLEDGEEYDIC